MMKHYHEEKLSTWVQDSFNGTGVVHFLQTLNLQRIAGKNSLALMYLLNQLLKYIIFSSCGGSSS